MIMNVKVIWGAVATAMALVAVLIILASARGGVTRGRPAEVDARMSESRQVDREELRKKLTAMQYHVTQENGTEPAFNNPYEQEHRDGLYLDIVSGEPLFSSRDKFDSGCGWPSFSKPLPGEGIAEKSDTTLGMTRTEVRSRGADSHLGHVFNDGPAEEGGLRYCINSAALRFVLVEDLEKEGLGSYLPLFDKTAPKAEQEMVATLAGGCFWGMEDLLREQPGVISTEVGYTGGQTAHATYEHHEGHAEAIQIHFDPSKTSYDALLHFFFRMHDPTTLNRQGNDAGTSYRSAIFYHGEEQRRIAEKVRAEVDASGKWKKPVVTEIVPAGLWWKAEEYHQDYLEKHPGGYSCHYVRD